ncbi:MULTISPECIES: type II toxin-antitoxin system PrlF family antitoxin [Delftia]|jgi:antitoxin PrlF|uniref:Type II toxin-antitoxin system PrlF family antitoxin n=1 Tax=Delftia tsuruhatensis TaxID=180282 RepID=A0AAX3ST54_9BURK|nr:MULTISPECIES: type II toxin-antitoxin system PrlF family antitoxin [Delftia]KEH10874.1 AbrB family transcriptional regulator [Delftia tsuruhatensis]MBS3722498.1 hypothetical protein [Delftia sp. PE138]MCO5340311.1 type II toxin-antitoxin system PrlF family antitoxin [Delftia tsuruhatensis]MCR4545738.1 type II toxin-antitoxin system PrlF family antitoxin [Delftia tsuruhatensis]MCX7507798.1 type II toxin-antitoxin system PrlF family antitoxin [Delftia tsuruhatensis]
MPDIHELATLTSKGQVTLPKPIRQALGVDAGGKIAFRLREDGLVVVSRAEEGHQDPAIAAFLDLLAADIQSGQRLQSLPDDLARDMLALAGRTVDLDDDIQGDVVI